MSDSDGSDAEVLDVWTFRKRSNIEKKMTAVENLSGTSEISVENEAPPLLRIEMKQKFDELRERHLEIREGSKRRREKTEEKRRIGKRLKSNDTPTLPPPWGAQERSVADNQKWQEVKPYLNINKHLAGPVSHGALGPKTELEHLVDEAVQSGDFDKAEALSDRLANREFGVEISRAFEAKRYAEKKEKEVALEKLKRQKKLHWGFEAKQRWEMKGNM